MPTAPSRHSPSLRGLLGQQTGSQDHSAPIFVDRTMLGHPCPSARYLTLGNQGTVCHGEGPWLPLLCLPHIRPGGGCQPKGALALLPAPSICFSRQLLPLAKAQDVCAVPAVHLLGQKGSPWWLELPWAPVSVPTPALIGLCVLASQSLEAPGVPIWWSSARSLMPGIRGTCAPCPVPCRTGPDTSSRLQAFPDVHPNR